MDLGKYVALFLTDGREHLQQCNALLLEWERAPSAAEPVAGLFRAIHTIKGMAATLGYTRLTELSHALENLLAAVRDGGVPATPDLIDTCFRAVDAIEAGLEPATEGRDGEIDRSGAILAELATRQAPSGAPGSGPLAAGHTSEFAIPVAGMPVADEAGRPVRVGLRPDAEMLGARAALVLLKAELLGRVSAVDPPRERLGHEGFTGELRFRLHTAARDEAIAHAIREAGEVVDVLVGDEQAPAAAPKKEPARQVRVDLRRLDALVSQVSELVVARNRLDEMLRGQDATELGMLAHRISRLVSEVQDGVMQSRMAPVAEVFDRFPRPVRDLARQLGKRVRLEVEGSEIELDRAILDELGDPLLHLLRNAVDHGLEAPDARRKVDKPEEGTIRLRAARERNTVMVSVEDDGRGVDRQAVVARARRDGLAVPDDPDDDTLLRLLARPGFSTSRAVTGVSGRGVGIDVVFTRLRALGGRVEIRSAPGAGTVFQLRLPLTLAIVQALVVEVGRERYAVPLAYVTETAQCEPGRLVRDAGGLRVDYRGQDVPAHPLDELAHVASGRAGGRRPMVILEAGERRAALVVDTLVGKQDIVVEPVEAPVGMPRWLNGATILGDGVPVLVLDPAALL